MADRSLSRRDFVILIAASVALQAIAWVLLITLLWTHHVGYGFHDLSDTEWYLRIADQVRLGWMPYRDFPLEYPPLALPLILFLPAGTVARYEAWFSLEMIVICATAAALTTAAAAAFWRGLGRPLAVAVCFAVIVAAGGAITANRYDAAVALVLSAFVLFVARRHATAAAGALGVGVALKLTPAILLPLALLLARGRRGVLWALAAFFALAALPFVPFLGSISGLTYIFEYHARRPLQIESVAATPYLVWGAFGTGRIGTGNAAGSQFISGPGTHAIASASLWVCAIALAGVYAVIWRRRELLRDMPQHVPLAALTCVLVLTVCSKVLSPQFLVWTFPLVALVLAGPGRGQRITGALAVVAVALTQVEFPSLYWRVVALAPGPVSVVVVRNLVLVAATVTAVVALWRLPRSGAST